MSSEATTAKLFVNGKSQAVRIPKMYEFQGIDEVIVTKKGDTIILSPVRKNWTSFMELSKADDDFMSSRPKLFEEDRVKL